MKKTALLTAALCLVSVSALAKVECVYDVQHEAVIYNTSKKATGTNVATLDFFKTVTKANEAYYHVMARFYSVGDPVQVTGKALLVVDNALTELTATPLRKYGTTTDFTGSLGAGVTVLDYVLPENLVAKLRNHKSQVGLQVFFTQEKPRILTLDKKGNEELRLITNLRFEDFAGVRDGKITRAKYEGEISF